MISRPCLGFAIASWLACVAPTAAAQSETDERARLHFQSGRAYFEEGAYERALQEFEEAYRLSPRTAMLFNLGTTYERLGRLTEAADAFQRFIDESPDVDNRDVLERRVHNLRRRAAQQASTGTDPGDEEATADPRPGPPATTPGGGGGAGDGLVIGGAIGLGVAAVGLVLTGIFGAMALGEQSAVENGCFASMTCTPSMVAAMGDLAIAADVSWISATVIGAASAVLLILGVTSSGGGERASIRFNGLGVEGSF